jgi:hypothetical protein
MEIKFWRPPPPPPKPLQYIELPHTALTLTMAAALLANLHTVEPRQAGGEKHA